MFPFEAVASGSLFKFGVGIDAVLELHRSIEIGLKVLCLSIEGIVRSRLWSEILDNE
jgi:hypothetical protein